MSGEGLSENLLMVLLAGGVLWFFFYKARKRRAEETYAIAYAAYSEAAETASDDLEAAFGDMIPNTRRGVFLLRLSLMNRGEKMAEPEDFIAPISLRLPQDSRVLSAAAVQSTDRQTKPETIQVSATQNNLEIHPFPIRGRSSTIFNIVVEGPAEPFEITARLKDQAELEALS